MTLSKMEALYAKLYDNYTKLKKNKFSELDEVNREQEDKFLKFISASDELSQHLRNVIHNLHGVVDDLRTEITSIRSTRDKERLEYQKCIAEEERKNKVLSEEVGKLKEMIQERTPRSHQDQRGSRQKRKTPESPQVTTRSMSKTQKKNTPESLQVTTRRMSKSKRQSEEDMVETDIVSPLISTTHHAETENLLVSQPECGKKSYDKSSDSNSYSFQAFGEHMLGMKLSTQNQGEQVCIIASHPTSGLSFSLTLVNNSPGQESELLYKVISLGTFERVVPKWMKDVIMFSTSMCPVFFEKVSRVIKFQR